MTTIARQANLKIADRTGALAQLVIDAKFAAIIERFDEIDAEADLETCELGGCRVAELYARIDNRDGMEVRVCEWHADNGDVSYVEDYDY
jgi:phage tail sheath protein FI